MRIVFKVGTSLVTNPDNGLNTAFLSDLVEMLSKLHAVGHELVLVTSGAVAAGRTEMSFSHEKKTIPYRQALAAIGQGILMKTYYDFFRKFNVPVAQGLLTNADFINRKNFLNTRTVFDLLLDKGVIPIVNENDVTTIDELKFGDNDMLSAKTAAMISADMLVILTDVDGLFEKNPRTNPDAKLMRVVSAVDDAVRARAGAAASSRSRGGMITKVEAAAYVTASGISMWIVNGTKKERLAELEKYFCHPERHSVAEGSRFLASLHSARNDMTGTFFPARTTINQNRKKWLKSKIKKGAAVVVDDGAASALKEKGKSLLPSGITAITGEFKRFDVIVIKTANEEVGFGQVNYDSAEIDKIKKHPTTEIEKILGYMFEDEVIHRNNMVVYSA